MVDVPFDVFFHLSTEKHIAPSITAHIAFVILVVRDLKSQDYRTTDIVN
jgi:hypothetical protein